MIIARRSLLGGLMGILLVTAACTLSDPRFQPVTSPHLAHLGINVEAPGVQDWNVHEQRSEDKWFVLFKKTEPDDPSHTQIVSLEANRFTRLEKKMFDRDTSMRQFLEYRIEQGRAQSSERIRQLESDVTSDAVGDMEVARGSALWQERDNVHFPGVVLMMNDVYYFFAHPEDPLVLILVHASTREPAEEQRLSVDSLAERFMEAIQFD